jgi:hypothetical protein
MTMLLATSTRVASFSILKQASRQLIGHNSCKTSTQCAMKKYATKSSKVTRYKDRLYESITNLEILHIWDDFQSF